jgi:lysozyme
MKTSDKGVQLIRDREGCVMKAYRDTVGVWTIGVGHTAGVTEDDRCNEEQATAWLAEDLQWSEAAVNNGVMVPLEQHQFDALVSFVFNVGQGAFASSTMRRLLNEGRYTEIPAQFDRWHIPPEITSRRNGERDQFRGLQFVARS